MTDSRSPAAEYLRFLVWAAAVAVLVAAVCWLPARSLGSEGAVRAVLVGCALSLVSSLGGGIAVARSRRATTPAARVPAIMAAMALRFVILLALGAVAALSGRFPLTPLLVGVAISYLALLVVDTWYAVRGF